MIFTLLSLLGVGLLAAGLGGGDDDGDVAAVEDTARPEPGVGDSNLDGGLLDPTRALVDATGSEGYTIEDGPDAGAPGKDYVVAQPYGYGQITVDYDADTTFRIDYGRGTSDVTASLNSDISGPDGEVATNTVTRTDGDGAAFAETVNRLNFDHATRINVNVTDDQIGAHTALIDLLNPNDSLTFDFDPELGHNVHLVFDDEETDKSNTISVGRTAYVVATGTGLTDLGDMEIEDIFAADGTDLHIIAEVWLGSDQFSTTDLSQGALQYQNVITSTINDAPLIYSNIGWSSIVGLEEDGADDPAAVPGADPVVADDPADPVLDNPLAPVTDGGGAPTLGDLINADDPIIADVLGDQFDQQLLDDLLNDPDLLAELDALGGLFDMGRSS